MNGVTRPSYESRVTGGIWNYDLEIQCMDPVSCTTTISSGYIKAFFTTAPKKPKNVSWTLHNKPSREK